MRFEEADLQIERLAASGAVLKVDHGRRGDLFSKYVRRVEAEPGGDLIVGPLAGLVVDAEQ